MSNRTLLLMAVLGLPLTGCAAYDYDDYREYPRQSGGYYRVESYPGYPAYPTYIIRERRYAPPPPPPVVRGWPERRDPPRYERHEYQRQDWRQQPRNDWDERRHDYTPRLQNWGGQPDGGPRYWQGRDRHDRHDHDGRGGWGR